MKSQHIIIKWKLRNKTTTRIFFTWQIMEQFQQIRKTKYRTNPPALPSFSPYWNIDVFFLSWVKSNKTITKSKKHKKITKNIN